MIRNNDKIGGIRLNNTSYKIGQYADDTQLYLDGTESTLLETIEVMNKFHAISGLKMNMEKTKAIWIGSKSNDIETLCKDVKLDWNPDQFTVLGVTFSTNVLDIWSLNFLPKYNSMEKLLGSWKRRRLTLIGKITVIKSLGISKFVHLFMSLPNPSYNMIKKINRLMFKFLWNDGCDRIKRDTITKPYKEGGLQMINLEVFIKALKISWLRKALDGSASTHSFACIEKQFPRFWQMGITEIESKLVDIQNPFWKDVMEAWCQYRRKIQPKCTTQVLSEPLWYNSKLKYKSMYVQNWVKCGILYIKDVVSPNGTFKSFRDVKEQYNVKGTFLDFHRVLSAIPDGWKNILQHGYEPTYPVCPVHIKILLNTRSGCKQTYSIMSGNEDKPGSQSKWNVEYMLDQKEWQSVYMLPKYTVNDTKLWSFQYKLIHRILPTKSFLMKIKITRDNICSYCANDIETVLHLFIDCPVVKKFWESWMKWISQYVKSQIVLCPKSILFGFYNQKNCDIVDCVLLLAKYYIYSTKFREKPQLAITAFENILKTYFKAELFTARVSHKEDKFFKKWAFFYNKLNSDD